MDKIFIKLSILILEKLESVSLMELTVSHYEFSHQRLRPPSFDGYIRISKFGPAILNRSTLAVNFDRSILTVHFDQPFWIDQF